ncbi:MAG TPA: metallophosphoesterase [Candidatus Saccharimonadales bacterium]|nr:metallophosphoesterase [Candidatus Saccharimonadales bacterium]
MGSFVPPRPWRRALVLCALFALSSLLVGRAAYAQQEQTLVAVGDVHGNFDGLCDILKRVGLINDAHHWSGGQATFVQVGDLVDRGTRERDVLDLMIQLESEAPEVGGQVEALIGNHEIMNIMGDLRYATPQIFATFATPDSEALRKASYEQYLKWQKANGDLLSEMKDPSFSPSEQEWLEKHPPGFFEQRVAFSRNGVYGKWIREHHAIVIFNSILFLHGGIAPEQSRLTVDQLNSRIRSEVRQWDDAFQYLVDRKLVLPFFTFQETLAIVKGIFALAAKTRRMAPEEQKEKLAPFLTLGEWLCISQTGPLWYRGYDQWSDDDGAPQADALLRSYKVAAIVVGHTVQKTLSIRARFGGKVFLMDTGMVASAAGAGRASALQILGNTKFTAIYLDGENVLYEKGSAASAKAP